MTAKDLVEAAQARGFETSDAISGFSINLRYGNVDIRAFTLLGARWMLYGPLLVDDHFDGPFNDPTSLLDRAAEVAKATEAARRLGL